MHAHTTIVNYIAIYVAIPYMAYDNDQLSAFDQLDS